MRSARWMSIPRRTGFRSRKASRSPARRGSLQNYRVLSRRFLHDDRDSPHRHWAGTRQPLKTRNYIRRIGSRNATIRGSTRCFARCIRASKGWPNPVLSNPVGSLVSLWDQAVGAAPILPLPAFHEKAGGWQTCPHAAVRRLLRKRSRTAPSAATAAIQIANTEFTTQAGAAPTRRSRNGRKFQVVM